jgi:hypothetical protein
LVRERVTGSESDCSSKPGSLEHNFHPTREQRWSASVSIFRRGVPLARRDHEIVLVFAATMIIRDPLVSGALDVVAITAPNEHRLTIESSASARLRACCSSRQLVSPMENVIHPP